MVGHNDSRALHLEVLQSLHLKPHAKEILEGLDHSSDDSAEEKSSQQQGREVTGSAIPRVGRRRQEQLCDREPPVSFALWSTQVSVLHGPMCSRCFSCTLSPVHSQCGNFTGSLGEADCNFEASTARLNGPCFLQADSISSQPGSLRALRNRQVQPSTAARALQRANWKPSEVQEGGTLVSTLDQGPLLLQSSLPIKCCLFPPMLWL